MSECTLIFPHQLFDPHPALAKCRPVVFIEERLIIGNDPHVALKFHQQKVVLHRASMKTYAAELRRRGHDIRYRDLQSAQNTREHLQALAAEGFDHFHLCDPCDYLLEKRLHSAGVRLEFYDSPMFVTPADWLADQFPEGKKPLMARFYERQRKRMNILLNKDGTPRGGRWSFDEDNRKPMPKKGGPGFPEEPSCHPADLTEEAIAYVGNGFADFYGEARGFEYPVSHAGAETWFETFLEQRFQHFGDYEDALAANRRVLFHSVLTPMLNVGLLTPQRVIDRALEFADEKKTPLNSVEGFVRQIIGWREFMRGAYRHLGVRCRNGNFWEFEDKPIPRAFYEATTGIDPIDTAIRRALDHGYCHHIERLMLLGNFMLLCNFHPRRVYAWFMEMFVDAYDWVMVPNVFAMSQFADGGLITTKPYISGSNYVRRMSDFRKGQWCDTWDGLFWTFIKSHEGFFRSQHRLGMMARQLDKMAPEKLDTHRENAMSFLASIR